MAKLRYVFFDVGNTLLFPDRAKILSPIAADRHPTLAQWQSIECRTKLDFDREMETKAGRVDHSFWWRFHTYLLEGLGENIAIRDKLVENTRNSANWDQILPGTREALQEIGEHFRTAVISNSDGGIDRVLSRCGIAGCFESITDSGIIGIEKPHREIFDAALQTINARADESLYVGDLYSVDFVGARNAGMDAILLDVAGAYRDHDVPRAESLEQLENRLERYR
jgi:HAD superfamily hydrolase (TIGR01549 family)